MIFIAALLLANPCFAKDGDTIQCGRQTVRVLGIDAPELPGHCRAGRTCMPGDPVASKASAAAFLARGTVHIHRIATRSGGYRRDRYGRTLATVTAGRRNLSCVQLRAKQAFYRPEWDDGGRVIKLCRKAATARTWRM